MTSQKDALQELASALAEERQHSAALIMEIDILRNENDGVVRELGEKARKVYELREENKALAKAARDQDKTLSLAQANLDMVRAERDLLRGRLDEHLKAFGDVAHMRRDRDLLVVQLRDARAHSMYLGEELEKAEVERASARSAAQERAAMLEAEVARANQYHAVSIDYAQSAKVARLKSLELEQELAEANNRILLLEAELESLRNVANKPAAK